MNDSPTLDLATVPGYAEDPYPTFAALRAEAPVRRVVHVIGFGAMPIWLISRAEDITAVLTDRRFASNPHRGGPWVQEAPWLFAMSAFGLGRHLTVVDAPDHGRLRRLISKVFTVGTVAALRPKVVRVADELLTGLLPLGRADLLTEYGFPLQVTVISELIGVPEPERAQFIDWVHVVLGMGGHAPDEAPSALAAIATYLDGLMARKRAEPTGDLLSDLVAVSDAGDRLTDEEVRSLTFALLTAGYETTALLIANGLAALLRHPDQLALLRARPELLPDAIEEILRYDAPVDLSMPRFATEDMAVGGVPIAAGDAVLCAFASANRDLPVTGDADTLDVCRPPARHMSFGHGAHFCIGAPLARLVAQVGIGTVLARCPDLALAVEPETMVKVAGLMMRRMVALPVTFANPAAAAW